jgi:uncharacterized protein YfaA (DUF2138 family)
MTTAHGTASAQPASAAQAREASMLYPEIFKSLERVRWSMENDVPWHAFDASLLSDEQARTIKMNAITEWAALPATAMFPREQPRRQRLPGVHPGVVLRGAEAP